MRHFSPFSIILLLQALMMVTSCGDSNLPDSVEAHRPAFHFTPPSGWMNDPNGMVWHNGIFHLFYQHYPDSTVWGPMHWGHASSTDLVSWEHRPVAIVPDERGWIFSGSAVYDRHNTSRLGTEANPPLVAVYTCHDPVVEKSGADTFQNQAISYSLDSGKTWIPYDGPFVLPNPGIRDFRDPKVFWHSPRNRWVMALAVTDHISIYSSSNLLDWTHESDFGKELGAHGGVWECPDLFWLPVEGSARDSGKWVMLVSINPGGPNGGSATQYFIGDFDGSVYSIDTPVTTRWVDWGKDNYAGVTWSDIPEADGRRIFLGWMSNWLYGQQVPTDRWRSAMTIPRALSLMLWNGEWILQSAPVEELQALRKSSLPIQAQRLEPGLALNLTSGQENPLVELVLEVRIPEGNQDAKLSIVRRNDVGEQVVIGFEASNNEYFCDRRKSGKIRFGEAFAEPVTRAIRHIEGEIFTWHVFFDRSSVECFADSGTVCLTETFFPNEDFNSLILLAEGVPVDVLSGTLYSLGTVE